MPTVPCQQCGKMFYVRPSHLNLGSGKYCSKECAAKGRIKKPEPCPCCGKLFVKRPKQIYCSRSCAAKANHASSSRTPLKSGICKVCKKEFVHGVAQSICSHACLFAHKKKLGCNLTSYALEFDPWETGDIQPDRFADNIYRQPDPVLGF